jgi:hypothetical protein
MADAGPGPSGRTDEEERNARATALLDEAQQAALEHGRAVVAEARAVRRRMLEDADQRRRELIEELERLRSTIEETITALSTPTVDPPATNSPADARAAPRPTSTEDTTPQAAVGAERNTGTTDPGRIDEVFDQLRADPPPRIAPKHVKATKAKTAKVARPKAAPTKARTRAVTPAPADEPPASPDAAVGAGAAVAPPADDDTPVSGAPASGATTSELRRRDDLLLPLLPDVVRSAKRLLQDEQNSLLDTVRRTRGKQEANRLLAEPVRQRETWTALLAPSINAAYLGGRAASGKAGRLSRAPDRVVVELAAVLCNPLRERITATIDAVVAEGPYESSNELQRALGAAIGARFREWRGVDLEDRIRDVLAAAYARGAYEASGPAAMLQWLPDEAGRCPDCDDNALEPTLKGKPFPTGQTHPPAHPGCRCVALPVAAEGSPRSGSSKHPQ